MPETGRVTGHIPAVTDPLSLGRNELAAISTTAIRRLSRRVTAPRFRTRRTDATYLEFVRALTSLLEVHVSIAHPTEPRIVAKAGEAVMWGL
ncbi:MAG TPA: hypothetical protein HA263_03065 [Methanoregulaceae archaeon]|nr:hypothetical protein [Methanoregulaceae archaeon]